VHVLLAELERRIWNGQALPSWPRRSVAEIAERVRSLSDLYTIERRLLARGQADPRLLEAKTHYFLAADAPKIALALDECARRDPAFGAVESVLDVGCGVGATSVGVLLWIAGQAAKPRTLRVVGVDRDPAALAVWDRLVAEAAEIAEVRVEREVRCADLLGAEPSVGVDLVVCQAALNELLPETSEPEHAPAAAEAVRRWSRIAPTLIVEPGTRPATRALQRLRDRVLLDGTVRVVAPCPHGQPCPMLARPGDWCHERRVIEPTPMVAAVQALTRRRDEHAVWSFQAFAPGQPSVVRDRWRLVTDPLGSRGKTERVVCTAAGALRTVRVLDRERSAANAALIEAPQGALVEVQPPDTPDRLGPGTEVHVVDR
jgi:ribosomal protein RSM22 (predicted rRNA methylase)